MRLPHDPDFAPHNLDADDDSPIAVEEPPLPLQFQCRSCDTPVDPDMVSNDGLGYVCTECFQQNSEGTVKP